MNVSIIICTCNRAASLQQTIEAMERVIPPKNFAVELLIVDNASTDQTSEVARTMQLPNMKCVALFEPKQGQVHARNCGLKAATGELIVFTDDDVRPAPDWLQRLCEPLAGNECDAVIGAIKLAPHLERSWMTRRTRSYLAATEGLEDGWLTEMVGGNMAFHRRVLERVPRFDEELGPGALGFGDDTLFSWQLEAAGFRLGRAPLAVVEHHCEESRLLRSYYLNSARKHGRTRAYLLHHWQHEPIRFPRARLLIAKAKLARRHVISAVDTRRAEGCAEWEISLTAEIEKYRQYLVEQQRPRNYEKHGLQKLSRNGEVH